MGVNNNTVKTSDVTDANVARLVAGAVVVVVVVAVFSGWWGLFGLLGLGFALRAVGKPSPFVWLARQVASRKVPVFVPAAPKRFSQGIGLLVCAAACVLGVVEGFWQLAAVILLAAASMEAFLGFCAGCWVYQQLGKTTVGRKLGFVCWECSL